MHNIEEELQTRSNPHFNDYDAVREAILSDKDVQKFIQKHGINADMVQKSLSKFDEYIKERDQFQSEASTYIARGYQPILIENEGYVDVSYVETQERREQKNVAKIKNRISLVNLPQFYREVTLADFDLDDDSRVTIFKKVVTFISQLTNDVSSSQSSGVKGLYLFGDFGVGKTFLMAAMAHELSKEHGLATTLIHFPSFTVDIKNAINTGKVKEKIDETKQAAILVLDDIGAEQMSSWIRDDVLQVILQYRMQENLPTFFTSNFSLSELESHFAQSRSGDETWQAKRIMERIRYLATELKLDGENRRNQ